jgi:hypothetical protein
VTPLTVRYRGGTLDGTTRVSTDDQVPNEVATSGWERYVARDRRYVGGVLVEVVYCHAA